MIRHFRKKYISLFLIESVLSKESTPFLRCTLDLRPQHKRINDYVSLLS